MADQDTLRSPESAGVSASWPGALRVVAADADPWMRLFYQELLAHMGHEVVVFASGLQLLKRCSAVPPDLVLTDVRLDELDGLEAAEQIGCAWLAPVILVSADRSPAVLTEAARLPGVFGFLPKPVTERELAPAIAVAVGRFRQLRQLHELANGRGREVGRLRQAVAERESATIPGIVKLAKHWPALGNHH